MPLKYLTINQRPIGMKSSDPNDGSYLCPNDLILGRSSVRTPGGFWEENQDPRKRWQFVQKVINSFWRKWQRDFFPSLLIRQKWHYSKRNLMVDVVIVQDSNTLKGTWKLAQVAEAKPGSDANIWISPSRRKNN